MKQLALKIIYNRLAKIAGKVVKKHNPYVIAITGSVGKTSTKEAITAVLRQRFHGALRATFGNLNAEIGIPLTILGYNKQPSKSQWPVFLIKISKHLREKIYPKYLVLEMGVEHPGDIKAFCEIACPDIAIITAATPAHLANFSNLAQMQQEKLSLAGKIKADGTVIYNADDDFLSKNLESSRSMSYSICKSGAKIRAEDCQIEIYGNKYMIVLGQDRIKVNSKLVGRQMIYADLAAVATAHILGFSLPEIKSGLESCRPFVGRFNILPGVRGITIVDDTYNANPASVGAAADALAEINYQGRKVIILGNMNELGELSERQHLDIARHIDGKANLIILAGPNAKRMSGEISKSECMVFKNRLEIEKNLDKIINDDDLVLVKASQNNNYFEEIVKLLLDKKLDPDQVLVRQGRQWFGKKSI